MRNVKPAVLFVGGWYDAEDLAGPLKLFHALEKNGPAAPDTLVMGPLLARRLGARRTATRSAI